MHTHKVQFMCKTDWRRKNAVLFSDEQSMGCKELNSLTLICLVPWASYFTLCDAVSPLKKKNEDNGICLFSAS